MKTRPSVFALAALAVVGACVNRAPGESIETPIPVIYDTDLGEDIDDTWALCFLLNSPEVELKLVTTGFGKAPPKAILVAKILSDMGRNDIPIAVGESTGNWPPNYIDWAKGFDISSYKGQITEDGVDKLVETIMGDETGRLKLFAMGPLQNIAAALDREPRIAPKVELIAMAGSIHRGYGGKPKPDAENNVRCKAAASQKVFAANWKRFTIAPLDTAGLIQLVDERYQHVYHSNTPAARTVIEAYEVFEPNVKWANHNTKTESSILYDTLAVYLAWSEEFVEIQRLPLIVTDDGFTKIDKKHGQPVYTATAWKNQASFENLLVNRIAGSLPPCGTRLSILGVTASANEREAAKLVDGTRQRHGEAWAVPVDKKSEWFQLELGKVTEVRMLKIAFANGNVWREKFDVQVSIDGNTWVEVLDTVSGGQTRDFESFKTTPGKGRYIRITLKGHGSWHASPISEVRVYGAGPAP